MKDKRFHRIVMADINSYHLGVNNWDSSFKHGISNEKICCWILFEHRICVNSIIHLHC